MRIKRAKREKDEFMVEVKHALQYHVEIDSDGRFKVVERTRLQTWGPAEGEHKILTLGITAREYIYTSDVNNNKSIFRVKKALESMGRGVNMVSKDNITAALVKHFIFYPVLITFYENEDGKLELALFTARSFTASLAIMRVKRRFDKGTKDMLEMVPNEKSDGRYARMINAIVESLGSLKFKKHKSKKDADEEEYEEDEYSPDEYDEYDNDEYTDEEETGNGGD